MWKRYGEKSENMLFLAYGVRIIQGTSATLGAVCLSKCGSHVVQMQRTKKTLVVKPRIERRRPARFTSSPPTTEGT